MIIFCPSSLKAKLPKSRTLSFEIDECLFSAYGAVSAMQQFFLVCVLSCSDSCKLLSNPITILLVNVSHLPDTADNHSINYNATFVGGFMGGEFNLKEMTRTHVIKNTVK